MAFTLNANNLSGIATIDQPGGVNASAANFIDLYDYAQQYQPELIPQLHMANGKGKITGFLRITGSEDNYQSDQIQHMEEGRLHNILKEVTVATNTFTSPTPHNLRLNQTILITDEDVKKQATVKAITNDTVFVATPDDDVSFAFTGNVDIMADFGNSWAKGSDNFTQGRNWDPTPYYNHTHISKEYYDTNASDLVHKIWVETGEGPRWCNFEMARTSDLFDNINELTQIFHERKASGNARGVIGVVPQIETRGNIGNEYITSIDHLSNTALRAKQQGTCREFTVWSDHTQIALFRTMMSGLNAGYVNGANYGAFSNSQDMALKLDFTSVVVDGVTFHFTPWALLDDPTLFGNAKFRQTGLACLIVPTGNTYAQENGNTVSKSYLTFRYRSDTNYSRKKEIKIFGPDGTPQVKDAQSVHYLTEFTNQVIGANNFFVVNVPPAV
jgi:hypothetical protein